MAHFAGGDSQSVDLQGRVVVEGDAGNHEVARRDVGRIGLRARVRPIGAVSDRVGRRLGRIDRHARKRLPEQAKSGIMIGMGVGDEDGTRWLAHRLDRRQRLRSMD